MIKALIEALERFDSLESVISALGSYSGDDNLGELVEYLNDEADASYYL